MKPGSKFVAAMVLLISLPAGAMLGAALAIGSYLAVLWLFPILDGCEGLGCAHPVLTVFAPLGAVAGVAIVIVCAVAWDRSQIAKGK